MFIMTNVSNVLCQSDADYMTKTIQRKEVWIVQSVLCSILKHAPITLTGHSHKERNF